MNKNQLHSKGPKSPIPDNAGQHYQDVNKSTKQADDAFKREQAKNKK